MERSLAIWFRTTGESTVGNPTAIILDVWGPILTATHTSAAVYLAFTGHQPKAKKPLPLKIDQAINLSLSL
jgi:hypothetical protein